MNRDVPKGLIIISILVGLILFLGSMTYKIINRYVHREYIETTATFIRSNGAKTSDNGTSMYSLVYSYIVNGQQYYYETDYSTSVIPKIGSEIRIKYNPLMPNEAYSNSFNVFSVFQIVGVFFLSISLMILFSDIMWLRDLIIFLFTAGFIITFLINKFYNGGFIIAIIILGIMCLASIVDFITYLKNNKFHPLDDIKNEIIKSKNLKIAKKKARQNLSKEEIEFKLKKRNKIIKGFLLFFIPMSLFIFMETNFCLNPIFGGILLSISVISMFVGFFMAGFAITGFNSENSVMFIAGKRVNYKKIKNASLKKKIKEYHLIELICKIMIVILFPVISYYIIEDPLKLYDNFENIGRVQIFAFVNFSYLIIVLFQFLDNRKIFKKNIVKFILAYFVIFIIGYIFIMSNDKNKVNSKKFYEIMQYNNFEVFNSSSEGYNSTITIEAIKDDINIILRYYEFDNIKDARNSFDELKKNYINESSSWQAFDRDDYFEVDCDGTEKTWIIIRIRNSIIYGKANYYNKKELISIINLIKSNCN